MKTLYFFKTGKTGKIRQLNLVPVFVCFLFFLLYKPANAATVTSNASGDWNTSSTWSPASIPANNDDVIIASGHIVTLNSAGAAGSVTINAGGTLIINNTLTAGIPSSTGYVTVSGTGTITFDATGTIVNEATATTSFTLSTGATLKTAHTSGISSSGATGSIQVNGTITFEPGANYMYNGVSAQNPGTGFPGGLTGKLTIDNAAGVTLSETKTIGNGGSIDLVSGAFATSTYLTMGSTSAINRSGGSMTGTLQGSGTYNAIFTGNSKSTGDATLSGAGINNVTINLTSGQTLTLANNSTFAGTLTVAGGSTFEIGTHTLSTGSVDNSGSITINSTDLDANNGSFIPATIGTNTGTVTYTRQLVSGDYDRHLVASPVSGTLPTSTTGSTDVEFYAYDETDGSWPQVTGTSGNGIGYSLEQYPGSNGTIVFSGTLVNAAVNAAATATPAGGDGWNMLGNPFTSALDITDNTYGFLKVNDEKFNSAYKAVYIYDNGTYKYIGTSTGFTGGGALAQTHVQAGQGFFVLSNADNNFTFNLNMRGHNQTAPLKSAETGGIWAGLQLKVKFGEKENLTTIVYNDDMTLGLDPGYDVGLLSAYPDVEIYTKLIQDDKGIYFARQALPLKDAVAIVVPVGIDALKGGEVTFSASITPIEETKFLLEDREKGTFTDLTTGSYSVTLPANTKGTERFFLHASSITGIHPVVEKLNLNIWTSARQVNINGDVSNKAVAAVYDLTGKKIMETRLGDGYNNNFSMPSSAKGIYLVKVTDGAKFSTSKVVF